MKSNQIMYSASDLVKKSSRQLVFLRNKKEQIASAMQRKGIAFQSKITEEEKLTNKGVVAEELRGAYSFEGNTIFFCIDMVTDAGFHEIKSIMDRDGNPTDAYEPWYLEQSLLQCAFYKSLLMQNDKNVLFTPKFRLKQGFEFEAREVDLQADYFLIFGNAEKYKVEVSDPETIIDFYKHKVASLESYETATDFDYRFKRKEFLLLKDFFSYKEL